MNHLVYNFQMQHLQDFQLLYLLAVGGASLTATFTGSLTLPTATSGAWGKGAG